MTLIKNILYKGIIMTIRENLQIYKHKIQNKLTQENSNQYKHDTTFKTH